MVDHAEPAEAVNPANNGLARRLDDKSTEATDPMANVSSALAANVFAQVAVNVVLRVMKDSGQTLGLNAFDAKNRDHYGGLDPLAKQSKDAKEAGIVHTHLSVVENLAKLILVTSTVDAKYGCALNSLMLVTLGMVKSNAPPAQIYHYVDICRQNARYGLSRPTVLTGFLVFDQQIFIKAGGRVKANGEVAGVTDAEGTLGQSGQSYGKQGIPQGKGQREKKATLADRDRGDRGNRVGLRFASSTCDFFNTEEGCRRFKCIFRHACSFCNGNHGLGSCAERSGKKQQLQIGGGSKNVGFDKDG